jgi:hypothetical protein
MNGPQDKFDFLPDSSALTNTEDLMSRRIEEDSILEYREEEIRENAHKKLWTHFQQTASSLTQLYREQPGGRDPPAFREQQPANAWHPFQTAAGSLTLLYRDSLEEQRVNGEINRKLGYHRARKDILNWAKSKRRFIRREDLLNFIVSISPGQTVVSSAPPPVDQLLRSTGDLSYAADTAARHAAAGAGLPSLQDMLDLSRPDSGERYKRPAPPSSPSHDESMDSPSCKRSRMN